MDAGTGEIYAAASLPLYDPNDLSTIVDGSETQAKSITQIFEPGSIFKTVSTMAILENGVMGPEDEIFCPAVIEADEYQVSDAHERGDETMTLRQILDNSSNVGISLSVDVYKRQHLRLAAKPLVERPMLRRVRIRLAKEPLGPHAGIAFRRAGPVGRRCALAFGCAFAGVVAAASLSDRIPIACPPTASVRGFSAW